MSLIADTVGALTIGSMLQIWIYGLVTYQYLSYLTSEEKDPLWIRVPMLLLYALNTIHVAMSISLVWYYCIANYGHIEVFFTGRIPWMMLVAFLGIPFSAFIAQLFLIFRAFRLLSSFRWKYLVASLLTVFSVAGCTCGTVLGIRLFLLPSGLQDWFILKSWVTVWLVFEVISDCSIAVTLAWTLKLSSTSFQGSQRVLKRLLRASIQTGAIASIFAIITLVVYLCLPNTFLAKITAIPIGSIYCASVMDTLLSRQSLREMLQTTEPETYRDSHRERGRDDFGANTGSTGIRVELGMYDRKDKGKATGRLSSESHL
ncbi:hypothetical protein BKA70DRAFT_1246609 [Coprinopsis sp. MPI-PUGE-AT-0042]|nr:hypothetical protein BKA70DRAFT_1246609 [Coprinopsis sp. MPI-PUGE-AT-0042]